MKTLFVLSILLIGSLGCAVLNQSTIEIPSSKLTSETNPEFVDGNLNTESTLIVKGHIEKKYVDIPLETRSRGSIERKYRTQVEGTRRTDAVIKLDTPTYITFVEVYPASRISNLALMTTTDDPPRFSTNFDVVRDKQHINVDSKQPIKFQINRKILYLRLTADGMEDKFNSIREKGNKDKLIKIPLKGASIREVKFYAR